MKYYKLLKKTNFISVFVIFSLMYSVSVTVYFLHNPSKKQALESSTSSDDNIQQPNLLVQNSKRYSERYLQHCRAMFTIDKGNPQALWETGKEYEDISHQLPSLLSEKLPSASNYSSVIHPGTRLQLMNGSVPYIPCQIREYRNNDFGECCAARKASGSRTWIALVGDSSMRLKIHEFLNFLPPSLNYTYILGEKEVPMKEFIEAVVKHSYRPSTFDIIGRSFSNAIPPDLPPLFFNTSTQDQMNIEKQTKSSQKSGEGMETKTEGHSDKSFRGNAASASDIHEAYSNQTMKGNHSETFETIAKYTTKSQHEGKQVYKNNNKEKAEAEEKEPDFIYSDTEVLEEDIPGESYQFRLSLVWAPCGSKKGHPLSRSGKKVKKLEEWLETESIPDVIVIGYGKWFMLLKKFEDELVPFTELDYLSRPLINTLQKLASRTNVLLWSQSRYRRFQYESRKYSPGFDGRKKYWKAIMEVNQYSNGIPLIDAWLWRIFRKTGVWQWDSSLPFNLANLRECKRLNDLNVDAYPVYNGRWWSCADIHHSAYETSHVEIQMLLNLLCNSYIDSNKGYCCSK